MIVLYGLTWARDGLAETTAVSDDCARFPPVAAVSGVSFYIDKEGSKPDPLLVEANRKALANVEDFMACLERVLDQSTTQTDRERAYHALTNWAEAGAILGKPPQTEGRVARVFISTGSALIVLKFRSHGVKIDPAVEHWLVALASAVRDDYRDFKGNVYAWVGATNALVALMTGDSDALAFQEEAWQKAVGRIRSDGYIDTELARGSRALIYHQLTANGLLILRRARHSLGIADDASLTRRFELLIRQIGNALCDSRQLRDMAGADQEKPGTWGFRVSFAFDDGVLSPEWNQCGPSERTFATVEYGGDMRVSAEAIDAAHRHIARGDIGQLAFILRAGSRSTNGSSQLVASKRESWKVGTPAF
jgi:poly(beta-D-mannuronate) lyase